MRHFTRFTALFLAAALLLSGCSLSSERTEESSAPESSAPVSEAFDPLAVGLLGHTDSDSPLGTQPLGEDVPLTEALYLPDGLEGEMLRVCVYDSARQGYTLTRYPAAGNETAGQLAQAALDALYPEDDDFLRPLSDAAQDSEFIPGEWVEATARAIWGEEVPIVHEDAGHWTWHETEGVYTPPHMGIGSEVLPYPHSITQTEDGWTAEVSYLLMNMGGVSGTTEEYQQEWIPLYDDLDSDSRVLALLDTLPRWTVTARYDADGVLHLVSCQPAE